MTTIKALIKRHPLLSYFTLAFAITWGGILLVVGVGPGGLLLTKEQYATLLPYMAPAMLAGPSVAGVVMTGLLYGKEGFRDLLARMRRWRVGARWYAVALLTAPLVFTAVLHGLSLTSSEFVPTIFSSEGKATLVLMGIVAGLVVGIFEELGWTGFAIPTLLRLRYGVLTTGLIVGMLWGVWHFLVNVLASDTSSGALSAVIYLPAMLFAIFAWLTAYRVLMVWVYERTNGSLLVVILMHLSLVATTVVILNPLTTGVALVTWNLVWAAALWAVVGAVAVVNHGHLSRQPPLRRRVA